MAFDLLGYEYADDAGVELMHFLKDYKEVCLFCPTFENTSNVEIICNPEEDFEGLANRSNVGIWWSDKYEGAGYGMDGSYDSHPQKWIHRDLHYLSSSSLPRQYSSFHRSASNRLTYASNSDSDSSLRSSNFCESAVSLVNSIGVSLLPSLSSDNETEVLTSSVEGESVEDYGELSGMDNSSELYYGSTEEKTGSINSDGSDNLNYEQFAFCRHLSNDGHTLPRIIVSQQQSDEENEPIRKNRKRSLQMFEELSFVTSCLGSSYENEVYLNQNNNFQNDVNAIECKKEAVPLRTRKGFRKPIPIPDDVKVEEGVVLYDSCRREWKVFWSEEGKMKYRAYQCKKYGKDRAESLAQLFVKEKRLNSLVV